MQKPLSYEKVDTPDVLEEEERGKADLKGQVEEKRRSFPALSSMQSCILSLDPKYIALVALILQNAGVAVAMRYTIVFADPENHFLASTAVLCSEIMKLVIAALLCFVLDAKGSYKAFVNILQNESGGTSDWLKLSVPSILYTLQNSLQYVSMSMLSAPVFQVLYQMKIITTAVFSVLLLSRRISAGQWLSVVALAGGVALVQLSQTPEEAASSQASSSSSLSSSAAAAAASTSSSSSLASKLSEHTNSLLGLISVLCGCLTSGFAGVYFEMVLKASKASIWLRNIQLSVIGILMSSIACYMRDKDELFEKGFFVGYDSYVWGVIILQAAGGLIVALVVKHADNVLKGFATSLSIILSCVVSSVLFNDVNMNAGFVVGAGIVLAAVFGFGYTPSVALPKSTSNV